VLDPKIEKVLAGMLAAPGPPVHLIPIEQVRVNHEAEAAELSGPGEPVAEVRDLAIPGPAGDIPVRMYRPEGEGPLPVLVWLHGGGWAVGTLDTFDTTLRALANASGALALSVDYRLAPEHPFPAAVDDALAAVRWASACAAELGGDPARIAVGGDSAGGNLATVAARHLRGEVDLRLQVLVYPVTDGGVNTPSYREFSERFGLTAATMQRYWDLYIDGGDAMDPDASPLRADDLAGMAPAFVLLADHDVLRDEGRAYAAALEEAGVPVDLRTQQGTIHGFLRWLAATDVAREAVDAIGAALRRAYAA
jgi:acetyl esterase